MKKLRSKIALITGGTQSIGREIAALFHEQGAKVILAGRRDERAGKRIAEGIGQHASYLKLDVSNEADWQACMAHIRMTHGQLDILVNNAGIEQPEGTGAPQNPEYCSLNDWQHVHRVNLDGVFLGCKYGISLMKNNPGSSIINIGSRSGLVGVPASAAYASSKAAIHNHSKTVALYCASRQYPIRCNVIQPGAILTSLWDKELGNDSLRDERIRQFSQNIPLGRMGSARDVANAALFLASDDSSFMTGADILLDGGIMAGSAAAANETLIDTKNE